MRKIQVKKKTRDTSQSSPERNPLVANLIQPTSIATTANTMDCMAWKRTSGRLSIR